MHVDNKGKEPTQELQGTTFTAKAKYLINSTISGNRFVLSLHYEASNNFLFVNATKVYHFKAKNSDLKF